MTAEPSTLLRRSMQYLQAGLGPIDPCASIQKPLQQPGGPHVGGQRELLAEQRGVKSLRWGGWGVSWILEGGSGETAAGNWRARRCFTIMLYEQFKAVGGIHVPGWIIHDAP